MSGKRRAGEPGSRTLRLSHTMVLSERSTDELDPLVDVGRARAYVQISYKAKARQKWLVRSSFPREPRRQRPSSASSSALSVRRARSRRLSMDEPHLRQAGRQRSTRRARASTCEGRARHGSSAYAALSACSTLTEGTLPEPSKAGASRAPRAAPRWTGDTMRAATL